MDRSLRVGHLALCACARGLLREGISIAFLSFAALSKTALFLLQGTISLVVRYHIAAPDDFDNVLRTLLQLSAYHIEVLPLSSGKSGSVSGEVRLEPHLRFFTSYNSLNVYRLHCTQAWRSLASRGVSYPVATRCSTV